jgi:hypothetical protein
MTGFHGGTEDLQDFPLVVFDGPYGQVPDTGDLMIGSPCLQQGEGLLEGAGQADVVTAGGEFTQRLMDGLADDAAVPADLVDGVCQGGGSSCLLM